MCCPDAYTSKVPSLPHLSAEDRATQGKSLRNKAPRSAHAQWHALKNRPDSVETLSASNVGWIEHLVPIRFCLALLHFLVFAAIKAQVGNVWRKEHSPGPLHIDADLSTPSWHQKEVIRSPNQPSYQAANLDAHD